MGNCIQHPESIPVELKILTNSKFSNVSDRGPLNLKLQFPSNDLLEPGTIVEINFPVRKNPFNVTAIVETCEANNGIYNVKVYFPDRNNEFRARLIEQVCYIERYRAEILNNEGRELSGQEAAVEWISKFASNFGK